MVRSIIKLIVRARMLYADLRGHHGKRWDYEPGDWYEKTYEEKEKEKK